MFGPLTSEELAERAKGIRWLVLQKLSERDHTRRAFSHAVGSGTERVLLTYVLLRMVETGDIVKYQADEPTEVQRVSADGARYPHHRRMDTYHALPKAVVPWLGRDLTDVLGARLTEYFWEELAFNEEMQAERASRG